MMRTWQRYLPACASLGVWVIGAALVHASIAGCTIPTIPIEGRRCPCAPGWVCDPATAICERPSPEDGGIDLPPPPDWCETDMPDALFCQDFAAPVTGHERVVLGAEATISVTTGDGFETRGVLESDIGSSPGGAVYLMPIDPVGLSTEIFVKAHVFLPATSVVDSDVVLFGIHGESDTDEQALVVAALLNDTMAAGAFTPDLSSADDPERLFPTDRWVCIEMRALVGDGTDGELELIVDGESWAERIGIDTYAGEDFTLVSAGIYHSFMPPPFEVRIDRLVVDDQPIGCD